MFVEISLAFSIGNTSCDALTETGTNVLEAVLFSASPLVPDFFPEPAEAAGNDDFVGRTEPFVERKSELVVRASRWGAHKSANVPFEPAAEGRPRKLDVSADPGFAAELGVMEATIKCTCNSARHQVAFEKPIVDREERARNHWGIKRNDISADERGEANQQKRRQRVPMHRQNVAMRS